ncbi:MAG TPA: N-acetylmuramoyl-L-alanine amidase [Candidatus Binatia bacterium]|nr:N-acetylmuramoyl-L-alanine amidase [Candidatus Binatia bacterium]
MSGSRRRSIPWSGVALTLACTAVAYWQWHVSVLAQPAAPVPLSVYARQAYYTTPLLNFNGQSYVGLVELLEPLGTVDARIDGKKLKLKFGAPGSKEIELQFQDNKEKGKVRGSNIQLPASFVVQNGRGYIPLSGVSDVLAHALGLPIRLNAAAQRLFIGDVGERFTMELRTGIPSKLFVSFDSPVNPTVATEPGHIRFTFRKDPVLPGVEHANYNDSVITGARFTEHDGVGELDITGNAPMMANFADAGRTIVISGAPAPPPEVAQPIPPPSLPAAVEPPANQPRPAGPRFLVLIDPAHGGEDNGAAIAPDAPEKDVVLSLARRLQRELTNKGIASSLMRNSDTAISLEQRAVTANAARPALYVALHAANSGHGVHVFTAMVDAISASSRDFLPWDNAQSAYLESSMAVAGSVAAELEARKLPNIVLTAPLRPMANIAAPAIALEMAPPGENVTDIWKPAYQEQIAQSVASGIAAMRGKISEVRP